MDVQGRQESGATPSAHGTTDSVVIDNTDPGCPKVIDPTTAHASR
ncbi:MULTISPECIES: hypothetical protein [unclassified Actinotalea]|nr:MULTISPECIES: hypothetical protein [unclassified Actinotalea]